MTKEMSLFLFYQKEMMKSKRMLFTWKRIFPIETIEKFINYFSYWKENAEENTEKNFSSFLQIFIIYENME